MLRQPAEKIRLANLHSPVHEFKHSFRGAQGPRVQIERDALPGLALGGNTSGKQESLIHDAMNKGDDAITTAGQVQSNHCRKTAAAVAMCGPGCAILLGDKSKYPEWNIFSQCPYLTGLK